MNYLVKTRTNGWQERAEFVILDATENKRKMAWNLKTTGFQWYNI